MRTTALTFVLALGLGAAWPSSAQETRNEAYDCVVKPSLIVRLGTPVVGLLKDVTVDRGLVVSRGQVGVDLIAEVTLLEPIGGSYQASEKVVDRVLDAASGTFGVRLVLPNPDYRLPAGIRCEARFPFDQASRCDDDRSGELVSRSGSGP